MRANRNKIISQYQKEANLLRQDDPTQNRPAPQQIPPTEPPATPDEPLTPPEAIENAINATQESQQAAEMVESESAATEAETPAELCPHVLSVYESVMLIQLKRMIKRNTKAFAVMLKILIQGDPKRKIDD